jgi:hypothetical protein
MKLTIKTAEQIEAERAAAARAQVEAEARAYLAETDWMVIRAAETGKPVPEDVAEARAAARKTLNGPA